MSDYRGHPLLSSQVDGKGRQKRTSPAKFTAVTERFYLQDAVFVAVLAGPTPLLEGLAEHVSRPAFPLALGRRSCVPSMPLVISYEDAGPLWPANLTECVAEVPWQASKSHRTTVQRSSGPIAEVSIAVTQDDPEGTDSLEDLATSFEPGARSFSHRRVSHSWVALPTGFDAAPGSSGTEIHDPFALLGW